MRDEYRHNVDDDHWARMWVRQEARLALAREWWALAGGRAGARVADVGCGPGYLALQYAKWAGPTGRVVALDLHEGALAFLRARARDALDARLFDAENEPLEGRFDVVLVTNVLHHAAEPARFLAHLRAPGRTLLVAEFDPEGNGETGPPRDERLAPATLVALLREAGWRPDAPRPQAMEQYVVVAHA